VFGQTCGDCRLRFFLQAGHGRGQRPAFPAPSRLEEGDRRSKPGRNSRRGDAKSRAGDTKPRRGTRSRALERAKRACQMNVVCERGKRGFPWCCQTGLNCRPLHYQWSALPLSYGSMQHGERIGPMAATQRGGSCHKVSAHASAGGGSVEENPGLLPSQTWSRPRKSRDYPVREGYCGHLRRGARAVPAHPGRRPRAKPILSFSHLAVWRRDAVRRLWKICGWDRRNSASDEPRSPADGPHEARTWMTDDKDTKQERLARALRENLKRRKAQARQRKPDEPVPSNVNPSNLHEVAIAKDAGEPDQ
jgi:hypothetical protein